MKILTSEQMRNIDRRTTERFGIPSIVLMENAAIAVVDAIHEHYPNADRVAIFCGTGANGGDGLAVARHLENRGVVPMVILVGDRAKLAGDALTNFNICSLLGLPIYDVKDEAHVDEVMAHASDADVIVDAIFGTGLNRAPGGVHAEVIRALAEMRIPVLAVDLPSGANASSSETFDPCMRAEVTVTFAAPKVCHVFDPAATACGEIIVADISIPEIAIGEENVTLALTTPRDVTPHFAPRLAATHKGTYGHVGIVAGSPGRSGAAVLAARGAIRTGAGLVTVITDDETAPQIHAHSIESMTTGDRGALKTKDAVLVGPGLPDNEESYAGVRALVATIEQPLVIDASGLNAFAGHVDELNVPAKVRIITPHPGEQCCRGALGTSGCCRPGGQARPRRKEAGRQHRGAAAAGSAGKRGPRLPGGAGKGAGYGETATLLLRSALRPDGSEQPNELLHNGERRDARFVRSE